MIERQTAVKVFIKQLTDGKWVEKEGFEPSYVETHDKRQISRARILGTVVTKFVSDDSNFSSLTIDDTTDTIRIKTFKTVKPVMNIEIGDLVDVIGKVREFNGEIYIIPEIVKKVDDPNIETLRKLEIISLNRAAPKIKETQKPETKKEYDKEALRKQIVEMLNKYEEGVMFSDIQKAIDAPEEITESIVNDLLSEGICYEPSPGKIKKI